MNSEYTRPGQKKSDESFPKNYPDEVHAYNVAVCDEIGGIAERNAVYTEGISRRIAATGKTIDELTIRELLEIHLSYCEWVNRFPTDRGEAS